MKQKKVFITLIPVLFSFFVMGFADIIGVAVVYAKDQFNWTETQAGFLPSMVFLWFLLLSVPSAMLMNKIGRKNTVLISMIFTLAGMVLPFILFNELTCYIAFALIGIGNTILQVSLNPLLSNVVQGKMLTSSLTAGQFIKSVAAFLGPLLIGYVSMKFGSWVLIFPIYASVVLIVSFWLYNTSIAKESILPQESSPFKDTLRLLKNKKILLIFFGILCIVGLDVGMNISTPKLLMERLGLSIEHAGYGASWYFAARTVGTFVGTLFLSKFSAKAYFRLNIIVAVAALIALTFANTYLFIIALVVVIAFTCSCVFPVMFSVALQIKPDKSNEISGLLITGVSGGAIFPLLMGIFSDLIGNQNGSIFIIGICALYLTFCGFSILNKVENK